MLTLCYTVESITETVAGRRAYLRPIDRDGHGSFAVDVPPGDELPVGQHIEFVARATVEALGPVNLQVMHAKPHPDGRGWDYNDSWGFDLAHRGATRTLVLRDGAHLVVTRVE